MAEILDICDESGQPTGETVERERAHREGILHRTAHVWIVRRVRDEWEVLLQKRSTAKDSFPGLYDTSSAGHIPAGSEPVPSALRELSEELGITARPEQLVPAGTFRIRFEEEFHGKLFRDNEVTFVYVYREPVELSSLTLQESEVEEVRWFPVNELRRDLERRRDVFCVPSEGFGLLCRFLGS